MPFVFASHSNGRAVGFEQSAKVPEKQEMSTSSGAESGAQKPEIDQNHTRVIAAWTKLPKWIKAGIMAMVNSAK
jgi:hypothetical protein